MGQPSGGGTDNANPLVAGTFTGATNSSAAIFYGWMNVSIWGTFVGTVVAERSFDGGTTWLGSSLPNSTTAISLTAPASFSVVEPEHQVLWRLRCSAFTSGTISYRLSQASDALAVGGVGR